MALFQSSVVYKYLKYQDEGKIKEKWEHYKAHFLQQGVQNNIRNSKEEQYQEGFLRDLFVKILGYTLNPTNNFNLTTEIKNVKDSKKADGGIIVNEKVVGVIELKGTEVTDLSKIENQAFGYKNNQPECKYVITSNFEKIRFYIDNAIEHQAFDLFQLKEDDFKLLYLCLAYENIKDDIPLKIKNESLSEEDEITKELYKDYSIFKRELFNNLTQLNPNIDKLLLFKKSQKLLDRFLFLFFAEDRHLLPPNSVRLILKQWNQLKELDAYSPLINRFRKYFGYLNTGYKGKKYNVYPYNGGLFKPDEILDNVKIDDDMLYKHTLKLSEYGFDSEVDVNILGHIFENSLNEIEEIQTQLKEEPDEEVKVSKRKKDGVFYTPKYITKYIVENTVGKLCKEQKEKLEIKEENFDYKRQNKIKKKLLGQLKVYREWLLELTIVDPACGSGAFLNEALNYLIAEHEFLDELQNKLIGGSIVFPDIEKSILENNLFGVDINEESVEIAKLSLWLRTAQPNRKLNDLSNNIKCGNSLIDDPEVAGDKAFSWEKEFPQVFQEEDKHAYHLVFTTHNSRISQRMLKYEVEKGEALSLNVEQEIALTKIIAGIIKENNYNVLAYNICKDHVHLIVVCDEDEVPKIAKTIKGKSSHQFQSKGFKPAGEPLWSQKYFFANLENLSQPSVTNQIGHVFVDDYLDNAINYVESNRSKHQLAESTRLKQLMENMCCSREEAFATEYKGGFDVVIGNPPYVNANDLKRNSSKNEYYYLKNEYETAKGTVDLYIYFFEKGLNMLKRGGILSYITPNRFLSASYGKTLRKYILTNSIIDKLIDYSDKKVFSDASTYPVISFLFKKSLSTYKITTGKFDDKTKEVISREIDSQKLNILDDYILGFLLNEKLEITEKVFSQSVSLAKCGKINATSTAKEADEYSNIVNEESGFKLINTGTIDQFVTNWGFSYLTDKGNKYKKPFLPDKSNIISKNRYDLYKSKKIIIAKIGLECEAFYDEKGVYASINTNCIHDFDQNFIPEYIICWINSKLYTYVFECLFDGLRMSGGYLLFSAPNLKSTFIKPTKLNLQTDFKYEYNQISTFKKDLQEVSSKFQRSILRKFPDELEKLHKKLQNWYELNFADFIKEFNKKLKSKGFKPLGLKKEAEWEDYFLAEQEKAMELKTQIDQTDKEIDQMVYELYGLTDEEIEIVENS